MFPSRIITVHWSKLKRIFVPIVSCLLSREQKMLEVSGQELVLSRLPAWPDCLGTWKPVLEMLCLLAVKILFLKWI